jgi:heme/copper-type cytochrome/quinol oxidase subunit 4
MVKAGKTKMRKFTWVILVINLLFLIWVISGLASGSSSASCGSLSATDCQNAQNVGKGIGVAIVFVFWAVVDVILGVLWLITNRRKPEVVYVDRPVTPAS